MSQPMRATSVLLEQQDEKLVVKSFSFACMSCAGSRLFLAIFLSITCIESAVGCDCTLLLSPALRHDFLPLSSGVKHFCEDSS